MHKSLKQQLRCQGRYQRNQLSAATRQHFAKQACLNFQYSPYFQNARRIAGYMAIDNELDPQFILTLAQRLNKCCYLPVLAGKQLKFRQFSATTPLHANRYGILEPMVQPSLALAAGQCDVILVPLVQVDGLGHRLGMGKGFYDRTFSRQRILQRPWLIGLAYECQKLAYVPHTARDICLDALVTEKKFYAFSSH